MSGISTDNRRRGSEEVNLMIAIDGELAELRSDHKMCENGLQIIQKNFWFEKKNEKKNNKEILLNLNNIGRRLYS